MSKRTPRQQTKHDRTVERSAKSYQGKGYRVRADIAGFKQPGLIGGRRPDVVAQKGKKVVIVEVETKDTMKNAHDLQQRNIFRKHERINKNVSFRLKKAK